MTSLLNSLRNRLLCSDTSTDMHDNLIRSFSNTPLVELENAFKSAEYKTTLTNEMIVAYSSIIFDGPGALFGDPDSLFILLGIEKGTTFKKALEKRFCNVPVCKKTAQDLEMIIRTHRYKGSSKLPRYTFKA